MRGSVQIPVCATVLVTFAGCFVSTSSAQDGGTRDVGDVRENDIATAEDAAVPDAGTTSDALDTGTAPVEAPRAIAPLPSSRVSTQPTFRWIVPIGLVSSHIDICRERDCATPVASADVAGTSWTPAAPLPAGTFYWRVSGLTAGGVRTVPGAVWPVRIVAALSATRRTSVPDDFDGDGSSDLIVGDPNAITDADSGVIGGRVYVFSGGASGIDPTPAVLERPAAIGSRAGWAMYVSGIGDVNGDGFADAVVSGVDSVSVFVFLGSATGLPTRYSIEVPMTDPASYLGAHAFAAGDVNGDGFDDIMMGYSTAPSMGTFETGIAIYFGSAAGIATTPGVQLHGESFNQMSLAPLGDIDADGYEDIGAITASDTVLVYRGGPGGPGAAPSQMVTPPGSGSGSGYETLARAGDLNGDGFADVAYSGTGLRGFVYHGSSSGLSSLPTIAVIESSSSWGRRVLAGGDIDGDGFGDVYMGTAIDVYRGGLTGLSVMPFTEPATGVDSGYTAMLAAYPTLTIEHPPVESGTPSFRPLASGDFDRDGYADLVASFESNTSWSLLVYRGSPHLLGPSADQSIVLR